MKKTSARKSAMKKNFSRTNCHEKVVTSAPSLCAVAMGRGSIDLEQINIVSHALTAITSLWKSYQCNFLERLEQCGNQLFQMITVKNFLKAKRVQKLKQLLALWLVIKMSRAIHLQAVTCQRSSEQHPIWTYLHDKGAEKTASGCPFKAISCGKMHQ